MTEYYNLPVQYTDEERKSYAAWGIKKEKTIGPFFVFVVLIDLAVFISMVLYLLGFTNRASSVYMYLSAVGSVLPTVFDIVLILVNVLIFKPLDILCDKILKRPKDPRMLRLEPRVNGVQYQLFQDNDVLCSGIMPWDEWNTAVLPETNQIWIENQCLTIGANTVETIYPKNKQHKWMDCPSEKIVSSIRLKEVQKNLKGYLAYLEEQKREEEWIKQNQANFLT